MSEDALDQELRGLGKFARILAHERATHELPAEELEQEALIAAWQLRLKHPDASQGLRTVTMRRRLDELTQRDRPRTGEPRRAIGTFRPNAPRESLERLLEDVGVQVEQKPHEGGVRLSDRLTGPALEWLERNDNRDKPRPLKSIVQEFRRNFPDWKEMELAG